jgi:hypothetical protein
VTLRDLIDIAREWNIAPDRVGVPDLEWVDDGAGRVGFVTMTDIDRMTSPDSEPVDRVYAPGDPTDTENVEDAGPPHPQGTDKLSPEGNPA